MNFLLEKKEKLIPNLDNKRTQIPLRKVKNLYKARIKIKKKDIVLEVKQSTI